MSADARLTIVQIVQTRWTKKSRGAPAAKTRNAIAEAAMVPLHGQMPSEGMLWHEIIFDESRAFEPREVVRAYPTGIRNFNAAEIIPRADGLEIQLEGLQRLELSEGAHGRLIFNYCETEVSDGWRYLIYNKICVNAITGTAFNENVFMRSAPSRELRCLRNLP